MKTFERIIDRRFRDIVRVSTNQCGFIANCGTTDAILTARLLIEKHREKKKPLHLALLDLEKAREQSRSTGKTIKRATQATVARHAARRPEACESTQTGRTIEQNGVKRSVKRTSPSSEA
ncbi:hypothetical protein Y032_0171g325 [Ancylostoma ceylanicum]|uniref:Reverse transcriptase domain-containing protein n=1 Tax=Ancylostoma ceylanicum TaxID=53326 RepID=A0A016SVF8_9BILA|nr:hypothetical protein Y032_0171g325 [Ancylostoma ceylanicum]